MTKQLQNSFYLIIGTGAVAAFGSFFWFINTRLFSASQIGTATMLISAMNLISFLSLAGFDTVLVRFLWHSKRRNAKINTAISVVTITSTVLAGGFILSLSLTAPKLLFVQKNPWLIFAFIFFCITASLNVLTNSIFLAYRKTIYTLVINIIFSFGKMLLPFVLFPLGTSGIFIAAGLANLAGCVLSIAAMVTKFDYRPKLIIDKQILAEVKGYSAANYTVTLCNMLPASVVPFIIAAYLGTREAAYFYIAFMIANLLYAISFSATYSLLAESSHTRGDLKKHVKHTIWFISLLIVPSIVILWITAPQILHIFGKKYAGDGVGFLRLLALSGIMVSSLSIIGTIFEVTKQLRLLLLNGLTYALTTIAGTFAALQLGFGLVGVGWAWLAGNAFATIVGLISLRTSNQIDTDI